MNYKTWFFRALTALFLCGTAAAAILWGAVMTAKCEGFGCLGVGAMIGMTVAIHLLSAILGAVLIWMATRPASKWLAAPRWLIAMEALHIAPLLWFVGRMLLS